MWNRLGFSFQYERFRDPAAAEVAAAESKRSALFLTEWAITIPYWFILLLVGSFAGVCLRGTRAQAVT